MLVFEAMKMENSVLQKTEQLQASL
ncbi:MAG: hypothetical protein ACLT2Z_09300 [Eubacterium sp.]